MEPIVGQPVELTWLTTESFQVVETLVWYAGPLAVHSRRADGSHWLFYWVDQSESLTRWLLLELPEAELVAFQLHTAGRLWPLARRVLLADLSSEGFATTITEVSLATLPAQYWPRNSGN